MANRAVLIVEDDQDIRDVLAAVLDEDGHTTLTAANGHAALTLLQALAEPPVLILADLNMPAMSGVALIDSLRSRPRWASIPVVVLSASEDADGMSVRAGAVACLRKPVDLEELLEVVNRWSQRPPTLPHGSRREF